MDGMKCPPGVSYFGQHYFFLMCLFLDSYYFFPSLLFFSWPFLVIYFLLGTPDPEFVFDSYLPPTYLQDQAATKPT